MNVLSLFDGISCGRVALERVGIKVDKYYASEIDANAIKVTMKNYPDTIQIGDITKVNLTKLDKIDIVIGGSPCQGFSKAGIQLNFDDPRSKLFFKYHEIVNVIKPKYFLLENVFMKKEYSDVITEYMGVNPLRINSNLVSAQRRDRLYWTNIQNVSIPEDKNILLFEILESGEVDQDKSYCIDAKVTKDWFRLLTPIECERLQTLPDNYTKGVSNTQRYKMLGNGWTVDVIAHILSFIN